MKSKPIKLIATTILLLIGAILVVGNSGCTIAHVSDGRASYWRASLGGDYVSRGITFETTSNGIARVSAAGFDDQRDESFRAACKSLEEIAATLGKLAVRP